MEKQPFDNVWDALTNTPAESANMTARSDLLLGLQRAIGEWGLTQEAAAKRLGITRPQVNDLPAGKISKVSTDALVNLAAGPAWPSRYTPPGRPNELTTASQSGRRRTRVTPSGTLAFGQGQARGGRRGRTWPDARR